MDDVIKVFETIGGNLLNPAAWQEALAKPELFWATFIAMNIIIFAETGLLIGFFLPGDSLLVSIGVIAHSVDPDWPIHWLILSAIVSAIAGDTVGYWIGYKAGNKLFQRERSFFFRKDYLIMAQEFYERHGGKTIIMARFVPIIRTFAPVVAGIAQMHYRRFIMFNVVGGISWIVSMLLLGYTLHLWLEPILERIFGRKISVAANIDKVIIVIVFISIVPILYKGGRSYWAKRRETRTKKLTTESV